LLKLPNRAVRMLYIPEEPGLLVSDVAGQLHMLNMDLTVKKSSPFNPNKQPIYALTVHGSNVFTKDFAGNITKWDLKTLVPLDVYNGERLRDESDLLPGEVPSLSINRGITVWNDKVYVNNGYTQVVVLDANTFHVLEIKPPLPDYKFIEWICTENADIHAMATKAGTLYLGNLDTFQFPKSVQVDSSSNLHRVHFDKLHNRFIATQDAGDNEFGYVENGITVINLDGQIQQNIRFTNDDVEFLEFNDSYTKIYTGGFDGYLYVFDNTVEQVSLKQIIGPFSHQILDFAYVSEQQMYLLTQEGEVVCIDESGVIRHRHDYQNQCIWDIQKHPMDESVLYCATDTGVQILKLSVDEKTKRVEIEVAENHQFTLGIVRRVVPLSDGTFVGITRNKTIFRSTQSGQFLWHRTLDGFPRTLSINLRETRVLVATDLGAYEFDVNDAKQLATFKVHNMPIWTTAYYLMANQ